MPSSMAVGTHCIPCKCFISAAERRFEVRISIPSRVASPRPGYPCPSLHHGHPGEADFANDDTGLSLIDALHRLPDAGRSALNGTAGRASTGYASTNCSARSVGGMVQV